MTDTLEYFKVGKIVTTRGLKGEIKIYPHTDKIDRFKDIDYFFVGKDRGKKYLVERAVTASNNSIVVKLEGYDTIESVQGLIGKFIFVDRDNSYELDEDELFIADMIGMDVETLEGDRIGKLVDVLQYAANDVYVVKSEDSKEYLIPATYEIVPDIDTKNRLMRVKPIPGLLD
ncbi:16S rRNA processing protein RimM [Peptostreptococcus sp. MV1]|uniref:ribosome maturation factor RimM n=1 Tax=Peptostreptococcus sp. MV1 TaxID=1219626 RepID=UPI00050D9768|nr:ribosome maturation factor RimM [Peptostreptococcus sp. MV1]KGF15025.1 16S rRNA processing protein RimM [Peptostreptococcus sp. MV1]